NPNGPEILFIHGFSQSHLSWIKQVTSSDLAKEFHMVTYDLRGHGNSDKPFEPERYKTSKYWGDEVQAVMDATGLKRPVLVGWSYGGRVMADYLTTHGTAKLAGLNYVDAGQKSDPSFFGPNLRNLPLMASEDLATNIAATQAFLHDCFSIQPTQEEYETMLAFNMMVPPKVRLGLSGRPLDVDDMLRSLKLPVLVTHEAEDKNSNLIAAEYTAKRSPALSFQSTRASATRLSSRLPRASTPNLRPSCAAPRKGIKFAFSFLEVVPAAVQHISGRGTISTALSRVSICTLRYPASR